MPSHFDEADLLGLIEDSLTAEQASQLRDRLGDDPRLLAVIDAMRRDRNLLRSLDSPVVPADLLDELEPILARPMLITPTANELRRRHQRGTGQWRKVAVAAGLAIVCIGGVWAMAAGLLGRGAGDPSSPNLLAQRDPGVTDRVPPSTPIRPPGPPTNEAAKATPWPPLDQPIHHGVPLDVPVTQVAKSGPVESSRSIQARDLVSAGFAVVLQPGEVDLGQILATVDGPTALVANFSFTEAMELSEDLRLADGAGAPRQTRAIPFDDLARDAVEELDRRERRARARAMRSGRPLFGSRELAAPLERQLEFSSYGAAFTISVPADRLAQLLEALQSDESLPTFLIAVGQDGQDVADELTMLERLSAARDRALEAAGEGEDAVILLPVIIESN